MLCEGRTVAPHQETQVGRGLTGIGGKSGHSRCRGLSSTHETSLLFARLLFILLNWFLIFDRHWPAPMLGLMLAGGVCGGVMGSSDPDISESRSPFADQESEVGRKSAEGTEVGLADVGRRIPRPCALKSWERPDWECCGCDVSDCM